MEARRRVSVMTPSSLTVSQPLLITQSTSCDSGSKYRLQTMPSDVP